MILLVWIFFAAWVAGLATAEPPGRTTEGFWSLLILVVGAAYAGWVHTPYWMVTTYGALGGAVNASFTVEGRRQFLRPPTVEAEWWDDLSRISVWVGLIVVSVVFCRVAALAGEGFRTLPPASPDKQSDDSDDAQPDQDGGEGTPGKNNAVDLA